MRKRTNKNCPAKGILRDMADKLWSLAVKDDWGHACAICGHRGDLNSHHLIPRQHYGTRYSLDNGICLCRRCHQFCPDYSPHQNAGGFIVWLEGHHETIAEWYFNALECGTYLLNETKNADYYCEQILMLKEFVEPEDYERTVGKKFSAWLEETPVDTDD